MAPEEILAWLLNNETALNGGGEIDWTGIAPAERIWMEPVLDYARWVGTEKPGVARRRAKKLLLTLLDEEQTRSVRQSGYFYVTGSAGGTYRLHLYGCGVHRVERHGKNLYGRFIYCLHSPYNFIPPADDTIAQMLLLLSDEPAFLAAANRRDAFDQLWNGRYLRDLRAARVARMEGVIAG